MSTCRPVAYPFASIPAALTHTLSVDIAIADNWNDDHVRKLLLKLIDSFDGKMEGALLTILIDKKLYVLDAALSGRCVRLTVYRRDAMRKTNLKPDCGKGQFSPDGFCTACEGYHIPHLEQRVRKLTLDELKARHLAGITPADPVRYKRPPPRPRPFRDDDGF